MKQIRWDEIPTALSYGEFVKLFRKAPIKEIEPDSSVGRSMIREHKRQRARAKRLASRKAQQ